MVPNGFSKNGSARSQSKYQPTKTVLNRLRVFLVSIIKPKEFQHVTVLWVHYDLVKSLFYISLSGSIKHNSELGGFLVLPYNTSLKLHPAESLSWGGAISMMLSANCLRKVSSYSCKRDQFFSCWYSWFSLPTQSNDNGLVSDFQGSPT